MAVRARKRFGQHFLTAPGVIDSILSAIRPSQHDHVIEIGPGRGALTDGLVRLAGRVTLVELDRDLVELLRRRYGAHQHVDIVSGDALDIDYAALGDDLRLVGNLPYNISTPLLFHLAGQIGHIRDMHFMLQKEVVDRITAEPGNKAYGRLTVMLACVLDAVPILDVPPEAFDPPPRVQSAVVRLQPRSAPIVTTDPDAFARLVTQAFSQRRKTLRNSLRQLADEAQMRAAGIDPAQRAETLSPEDFARLDRVLRGE
jgi:16S rRNA (adenine1518-N6/adenine1519-N6)-dimethyltransferase